VVVNPLPLTGPELVQLATGTLLVLFGAQIVATKPLLAVGRAAAQLAAPWAALMITVLQVRLRKLLPAFAVCGAQEATGVGPVAVGVQVMVV
jgi:hypothetical protein